MTTKAFFAKPFLRPIAEWVNLPQFFRHARVLEMRINDFVATMRLPEFFMYRTVADRGWKPPGAGRLRWSLEIPEVGEVVIEWRTVGLSLKSLPVEAMEIQFKKIIGKA